MVSCTALAPGSNTEEERPDDGVLRLLADGHRSIDSGPIDYALLSAAILAETNRQRQGHGLSRLARSGQLERVAAMHARDMVRDRFFAHTNPVDKTKSTLRDRLQIVDLGGSFAAENIADTFVLQIDLRTDQPKPYSATVYPLGDGRFSLVPYGDPIPSHSYTSFARDLVQSWLDSPAHRVNLLTRRARFLGCGCRYKADAEGIPMLVCVQVFYSP